MKYVAFELINTINTFYYRRLNNLLFVRNVDIGKTDIGNLFYSFEMTYEADSHFIH